MEACFQANAEKSFFDTLKPSVIHSGTEGFGLWTKERAKARKGVEARPERLFTLFKTRRFLAGCKAFRSFRGKRGTLTKQNG